MNSPRNDLDWSEGEEAEAKNCRARIVTNALRRPHTYTIINVSDEPRNWMLTNGAAAVRAAPPRKSIHAKSAVRPRKEPSSRRRQ